MLPLDMGEILKVALLRQVQELQFGKNLVKGGFFSLFAQSCRGRYRLWFCWHCDWNFLDWYYNRKWVC